MNGRRTSAPTRAQRLRGGAVLASHGVPLGHLGTRRLTGVVRRPPRAERRCGFERRAIDAGIMALHSTAFYALRVLPRAVGRAS